MSSARSSHPVARRHAHGRLALALLSVLFLLALPASASASYPWQNQAAMQGEPSEWLRSSFIIDTEPGDAIPRTTFLSQPYLSYYEGEGFDRNFFTWAPHEEVGESYIAGRTWTGCRAFNQEPVAGNWSYCRPSGVKLGVEAKPIREDVEEGGLTGFRWNESFVSDICGNWSAANTAGKQSPMPSISGTVYEDFNASGSRDPEDTGMGGWTVKLYYDGSYVTSATTAADGSYSFELNTDTLTAAGSPIGEGTYALEEVVQGGWEELQRPGSIVVGYGIGEHEFAGNDFGNTDPKIAVEGHAVTGTEGTEASATVATFTDPDSSATAEEYSANIQWGDGSESSGVVSGSEGAFTVSGRHTYAEEGSYEITVEIDDVDNPFNTATATSTATITDAALSSACATPAATLQAFEGSTAAFTDANPDGRRSDFSATIEWGDGTESAAAIGAGEGHGPYTVSGSHTYGFTGPVTVTTKITDDGGSTTAISCPMIVFAYPAGGGTFVIGDENAKTGAEATFWGSGWWRENGLSGNRAAGQKAPASFKGFADEPSTPSCGVAWAADPGNSAPPPAGPLPAYMGVIVSGNAGRAGPRILGDTAEIVVVQTNPGYRPNVGHAGTGTVVVRVC